MRNGQNIVVFAPRRYGKSSLLWRAVHDLMRSRGVLVAQVDLMKTPTKERLAAKLAASIYEDVASGMSRAKDRAAASIPGPAGGPHDDARPRWLAVVRLSGRPHRRRHRRHAGASARAARRARGRARRRVALVFDEFQEIVKIDRDLLPLMRSVFQEQPEVSHVYLGSRRHMMEQIFNDENEPFWRSARQMELGRDPTGGCSPASSRTASADVAVGSQRSDRRRCWRSPTSHPYGTQELAYALWEVTPRGGGTAGMTGLDAALARVLHSENAHFLRIWEDVLARAADDLRGPGPRARGTRRWPPPIAAPTTCPGPPPSRRRSRRWSTTSWSSATTVATGSPSRSWPSGSCAAAPRLGPLATVGSTIRPMPRPAVPLPRSASVVVIGGGVMGTSAAFHLAEAGVDVVLCERNRAGQRLHQPGRRRRSHARRSRPPAALRRAMAQARDRPDVAN